MLARRRRDRRGNYSALMFTLLEIVVGFGALSVDVSLITMSELQAQATADAAAHAALVAFHQDLNESDAQAAADYIVQVNSVGMGQADLDGPVEIGQWDYLTNSFQAGLVNGQANAARARVSRKGDNAVDLLLAPILGVQDADVDAEAVTAQQMRAIMLVVDMSCSMMFSPGTAVQDSRAGAIAFLDYIMERPQGGDMLGLAMFAKEGTKPASNGALWKTLDQTMDPWIPLARIDLMSASMYLGFDGICNTLYSTNCGTMNAPHPRSSDIGSCTHPGIAIQQAKNQLINKTSDGYFRGMVIMSDGVPTCGTIDTVAAVDASWSEDINIWSIVFYNDTFDSAYMESLVRGIGFSQISPSSADLPAMYEQVAASLPTAFVR
jgi:Putative Tad-like Flp pilus-assembly